MSPEDARLVAALPGQDPARLGRLAAVLRAVQWELDDVAHHLPVGRVAPQRLVTLATTLEQLAEALRTTAGIVPGDVGSRGSNARTDT